jgi:hypothetical protein
VSRLWNPRGRNEPNTPFNSAKRCSSVLYLGGIMEEMEFFMLQAVGLEDISYMYSE